MRHRKRKHTINAICRAASGLLFRTIRLIVVLSFFSCEKPAGADSGGDGGKVYVNLSLTMPAGNFSSVTRAMTGENEANVQSIRVLVFGTGENGKYAYTAYPEGEISSSENEITFAVGLQQGAGCDLVVLANSESILAAAGTSVVLTGKTKAEILSELVMSHAGKWNATAGSYTPFPMCSDPEKLVDQTISEGMSITGIKLYRMVARVNVVLGSKDGVDAKQDFDLRSVHLYNRNSEGFLKPVFNNNDYVLNAKYSPVAHVQSGPLLYTEIERDENDRGISCINEIYLFEVDNTSPGLTHKSRPCLVVGGSYNGNSVSYYRVDFSTGTTSYLDIVRNHSYQITINAVNGNGHSTSNDAFDSPVTDMEVEVAPWDDNNILVVVTDGKYELGVNCKEFTFPKNAVNGKGVVNNLIVSTTYPQEWCVAVMDDDHVATSGWLKIQKEDTAPEYSVVSAGAMQQNFYLQAEENTDAGERVAYIHVIAGRIVQVIKIIQSPIHQQLLTLTSEEMEVDELTWIGSDTRMKTLTATWFPVDRKCIITTAPIAGSGFEHSISSPFATAATETGGTQSYNITPQTITPATEGYPFVDRSSLVTFTLCDGEDYLFGNVVLRQVNFALTVDGSQKPGEIEVLTGADQSFKIKCNTDWVVSVSENESSLAYYTREGKANVANGAMFNFQFYTGEYNVVTFTFNPKTPGLFEPVRLVVEGVQKVLPVFALSNIVFHDSKYIFAETEENLSDIPANSQGLLFKWGSLIGIGGCGISGEGYSEKNVPFTPPEYKGQNIASWNNVPYQDVYNGVYDVARDEFKAVYTTPGSVGYDAEAGRGDICRYISDKGWVEGRWRMPTAQELIEFYNSGISRVGESSNWSFIQTGSHTGMDKVNRGYYFGRGVHSGFSFDHQSVENYPATRSAVYFPASGYYENDGILRSVSASGYYNSCSPASNVNTITNAICLNFGINGVTDSGNFSSNRKRATSVRCVRDSDRDE